MVKFVKVLFSRFWIYFIFNLPMVIATPSGNKSPTIFDSAISSVLIYSLKINLPLIKKLILRFRKNLKIAPGGSRCHVLLWFTDQEICFHLF